MWLINHHLRGNPKTVLKFNVFTILHVAFSRQMEKRDFKVRLICLPSDHHLHTQHTPYNAVCCRKTNPQTNEREVTTKSTPRMLSAALYLLTKHEKTLG